METATDEKAATIREEIHFLLLLGIILSFLSLPFWRFKMDGFFVPLPVIMIGLHLLYIWSLILLRKSGAPPIDRVFVAIIVLFLAWASISAASARAGLRNLMEISFYSISTLFMVSFINIPKDRMIRLLEAVCFVTFLLLLLGLYNHFSCRSYWFQFTLLGEVGSRNVDVYLVTAGLSIAISLLLALSSWKRTVLLLLFIFVFGAAIASSLSRGGLANVVAIFLFYIFLLRRKLLKREIVALASAMVLFAGGFFFHPVAVKLLTAAPPRLRARPPAKISIRRPAARRFQALSERPSIFNLYMTRIKLLSKSTRIFLMKESLQLMAEHPLTGVGLGNYSLYTRAIRREKINGVWQSRPITTAHNSFLNFGAEAGIPGFVIISLLILYPLYRYSRVRRKVIETSREDLVLLHRTGMVLSFYLIMINFFNVFYVDAGYIFWFFCSLSLIMFKNIKRVETP